MSQSKHFWNEAKIKMVVCDGTFTTSGVFKHTILLAVTFDGNNEIIILAVGICDIENADNWVWFQEHLQQDFPGFEVFMSDADKGITSDNFSQSQADAGAVNSRCVRHMTENCKKKFAGKVRA